MLLSNVLKDFYVLPLGQIELVGFHKLDDKTDLWCITWIDTYAGECHKQTFLDQEIQYGYLEQLHRGEFCVIDTNDEACAFIALDGADLHSNTEYKIESQYGTKGVNWGDAHKKTPPTV